jgi:hypothetical protein
MHTVEKKKVIEAIGELGRRVTPADVATKTGMPLLVVQQELNRVASETDGHLQVGTTGDVVYSFTPGFSTKYMTKGIAAAFVAVWAQVSAVLMYLLRISFGIALILSLVIGIVFVIAIAFAMIIAMKGKDSDRDGGFDLDWLGRGGFHLTFWDWIILRDIFLWNAMSSPRYRPVYRYDQPTVRDRPKSNFLLNCFSFLFGDGDPNEGLDEKRWQLIAQVIKQNNNVLTAEQLAPYTGADPKNEDAVLPVLVRFNGRPEVTPKGNIVYVFDNMQAVAAQQTVNPPAYLQEFPWKFSTVPDGELVPVFVVAGLNIAFIWFCWNFQGYLWAFFDGPVPFLTTLFNVLFVYAIAFIAIPLWRAVFLAFRNRGIDARNVERFRYGQIAQHPSPELQEKLDEAAAFKVKDRRITDKDIVFTTEQDSRDQADELSDRFKEMEAEQTQQQFDVAADGRIINVSPDADGKVINIKKHAEEFDASP